MYASSTILRYCNPQAKQKKQLKRGIASSSRLAGWLQKPINVGELREEVGGEVYDKRVKTFRKNEQAELPLTRDNFITLFDMFNGNSRFALDEAGAFCTWIFDEVDNLSEIPSDSRNWRPIMTRFSFFSGIEMKRRSRQFAN